MKILIDNGHGAETPGKRSPDGSLLEYKWAREMAQRISRSLTLRGADVALLVPEDKDVSISERCSRANAWCRKLGKGNVALVSIHVNAAPGSDWSNARGWLSMVDDAASQGAKDLADLLFDHAQAHGLTTRQYLPRQKWWLYSQALGKPGVRLGILRGTQCPAVLTENLFMTNKEDVAYLNSEAGKQTIAEMHVAAILDWINSR